MKNIYTLLVFLLLASVGISQTNISGAIQSTDGEPLIGANVIAKGTTTGTITDFNGQFDLTVPAGVSEIVVSYTGFQTKTLSIDGQTQFSITMEEGNVLDEVVVTALGVSREEKALGYSVQEVSSQTIENANTVSAIDALAGAAAGIQVTSSSGAAGAASRVVLRGQTSFNGDNEALIVVDGVRLNNSEFHTERSLGGVANSNRAMDINPNDIANITVLKGGAATALYGLEGARGVILITTKKGNSSGLKVDVNSNLTFNKVTNIVGLQDQFTQGWSGQWAGPSTAFIPSAVSWGQEVNENTYWVNDPENPYKWDKNGEVRQLNAEELAAAQAAGLNVTPFQAYSNVEDFFQTGVTVDNNVSISGGNDLTTYRLGLGSSNSKGIAPNNTFDRLNVSSALNSSLLDGKLDVKLSANFSNTKGSRIQQGSNISGVMLGLLRTPISFDNANGLEDPVNDASSYTFADNSQRNYRGGGGYDNPYWVANNTPFNDNVNRFFGNFGATYTISDWVKLGALVGTDFFSDNRVQRFEIGSRNVPAGQVIEDNYNYRHTDSYFTLSGNGLISDKLTLSYTTGVNFYDQKLKNTYVQGDGLNFYGFPQLGNTSTLSSAVANTNIRTAGVYGSVDFGYDNFLYLTLTGRNDWTSTLINPLADFKASDISFFYPSASLGFIFSEKMSADWLSFGKLRLSYAEVGGGAPGAYSTSTPFILPIQNAGTINDVNDGWTNGIGFPFQGVSGFVQSGVAGNPSLEPSRTKDIELGLDLRFFNNRVGLDMTYYTRASENQIIAINIPASTGYQRAVVNSGELNTIGGEVVLSLSPVRSNDFNWDINFNFSKWRTTIESMPDFVPNQYLDGFTGTGVYNIAPEFDDINDNGIIDNGEAITQTYEYGQLLGGAFQHVNDTDANGNGVFNADMPYNPDGALVIEDDPTAAGYGFPKVDPVARVIGNPNPDFLLGITNNINYKNLSLSFLFDIREGGDIWNGTKGAITFFGMSELTENRGSIAVFDGVKASGGANDIAVTLDQNWYTGNGGGFGSVAEHFIEDGSFRRLRFLTLGYDLGSVLNKFGIDKFTVSFTGRNLFLSTPYTGFDPELSLVGSSSNGQGLDYFQLPNTKSYSIGINATF